MSGPFTPGDLVRVRAVPQIPKKPSWRVGDVVRVSDASPNGPVMIEGDGRYFRPENFELAGGA